MENLTDYSQYVMAAYLVAGLSIAALAVFSAVKYYRAKKNLSGEK